MNSGDLAGTIVFCTMFLCITAIGITSILKGNWDLKNFIEGDDEEEYDHHEDSR